MIECNCDSTWNCGNHQEEALFWAEVVGMKPYPYDPAGAYDRDDVKGRYWEGWDA